ncbi:TlpA disulfide reductase family protein [Tannerella sp.]|uniref:TlpA family protein disulfide reductase n=1 Tax=Tannerella sp. TaxID=2382127 RepID=UPI0026DC0E12|nr:TlpA disulfide reductase family protein [Tannerella sp.]MDO4702979.1 TlpA disulfide reductase family protein [Tannerella sp.]
MFLIKIIRKPWIILALAALWGAAGHAQNTAGIKGLITLKEKHPVTIQLVEMQSQGTTDAPLAPTIEVSETMTFANEFELKQSGFFYLITQVGEQGNKYISRHICYMRPGHTFEIRYSETDEHTFAPETEHMTDRENKLLIENDLHFYRLSRTAWENPPKDVESCQTILKQWESYSLENLKKYEGHDPEVIEFAKVQAYERYLSLLYQLPLINEQANKVKMNVPETYYALPFDVSDFFDHEKAMLFPSSVSHLRKFLNTANGFLPNARLILPQIEQNIERLKKSVSNRTMVDKTIESMMEAYILSYKMSETYEQDKAFFRKLAANLSSEEQRDRLCTRFGYLKYTALGASFPDAALKNVQGETVTLEQFKGHYVYIDLWASWCIPCRKEISFLQKLEKAYEGKNIAFVSISLDKKSSTWKSTLEALQMHGHQLFGGESAFAEQLNVTSIPHFLLYNPDGKLRMYRAPAPSSEQIRPLLDKLLSQQSIDK